MTEKERTIFFFFFFFALLCGVYPRMRFLRQKLLLFLKAKKEQSFASKVSEKTCTQICAIRGFSYER